MGARLRLQLQLELLLLVGKALLTLSKLYFGTGNAIYILLGESALNKLSFTRSVCAVFKFANMSM